MKAASRASESPCAGGRTPCSVAGPDDEPILEPKLPARWALGAMHLALVVWLGCLFALVNHFPLRGTDLWGHVLYGRWILEHHSLPDADPFCQLAASSRVVDSAWLSQVILAAVETVGGIEWLSHLFALTVLATHILLARVFYLQSRSVGIGLLGSLAVFAVGFSRLSTIRPENFAGLCFAILLWLIVSSQYAPATPNGPIRFRASWRLLVGTASLMMIWTNLHGSFVCGLATLGCYWAGELAEVAWKTRSMQAVFVDRGVRCLSLVCLLATAATLVNPYGPRLLWHTLAFSSNPNLRDLIEWQPLAILGAGGREFALSWVVLLVVWRCSRRRVCVAHVLLLALFGWATVAGVRMIGWYAAVYGLVLVPHLAELPGRLRATAGRTRTRAEVPAVETKDVSGLALGRSWKYSLLCGLAIWIALVFSPISAPLLGRQGRTLPRLLGPETPVALTRHLRAHPPQGPIFNPQWWGDWLFYAGPPGLQPFVTSNVHLVPPPAWKDYLHVGSASPGWERILQRYGVRTLIVDKAGQPTLALEVRGSRDWRTVYQDRQSLVLVRAGSR